jgi:hypothetical protein
MVVFDSWVIRCEQGKQSVAQAVCGLICRAMWHSRSFLDFSMQDCEEA